MEKTRSFIANHKRLAFILSVLIAGVVFTAIGMVVPTGSTAATENQDALVLKYARENNFIMDLVLRAAGDEVPVSTEAITLEYMIRRFNITLPPQLQYNLDTVPPVEEEMPEKPEFPQTTSIETEAMDFVPVVEGGE